MWDNDLLLLLRIVRGLLGRALLLLVLLGNAGVRGGRALLVRARAEAIVVVKVEFGLEEAHLGIVLETEPVFGIVNSDEVPHQLLVAFADVATSTFLRAKDHVIVEGIVDYRVAQVLQMHANLVHAAGLGLAQHHRGLAVEAETLELGHAVLALLRDLADTDFVRNHLDWLGTDDLLVGEFTFDSTHVLLLHL